MVSTLSATAIGIGALVATGAPQAADSPSQRDVVIVVDNTATRATDWALQKRAYLAMLDDRATFPLDGSVAVSLVQYAAAKEGGQASRVTLPLTRLDSAGALAKARAAISEATLLTPDTSGFDGLTAAAQELSARGTKGSPANVCLTANVAWDRTTLIKGAGAVKSAGATRVGVLALTSPSLSAAQASQLFADAVFGDGDVVSARNVPEFGGLVNSSCMLPAVRLRAIEVNQVIQDWHNSVPLVQYKDTIARVFLETVARPSATASGLLHGERDGVPLRGSPLSPINDSGAIAIDSTADARGSINGSLNFRLPTSWMSGDVTLTFESPSTMTCTAAAGEARDCDVDVTFEEAAEPRVDYVSVPYEYLGTLREPTDAELVENMYRTEDIFPTRYVDFDFDWLPVNVDDTIPDLDRVNAFLTLYGLYEDCGSDCAKYYGILSGSGGGLATGIPGTAASGFLSGTGASEAYGYARNRGPHEIAHMYGAHHIVNAAENGKTSRLKYGWCTEEGGLTAPEFPHWFFSSAAGADRPSFGPLGSDDEEVWGMSPRFVSRNADLAVSDPGQVFPLMSYCGAVDRSSQFRWPSLQTYDVLADEFLGSARTRPAAEPSARPFIVVRGLFDPQSPGSAEFLPVAPVTMRPPATNTGEWSIRLVDRRGKALATRSFAASESHGDAAGPEQGEATARASFAVAFPAELSARIGAIQLRKGQTVVATQRASTAAPQVTIASPKAGVALTGSTVTVSWAAQDADSSELSATVLYRTSPKARWTPVAIDATGRSITVPRRAIEGSRAGEFMVIASDGVRSGAARVGSIRVADNPPIVVIRSGGDTTYSGAQNLILSATAWDSESGTRDVTVTWSSSIDGPLGQRVAGNSSRAGDTGFHINLLATDLSEGVHTITATATDSFGGTATATTRVTIMRVAEGVAQSTG
ncbi:MAG: hypothetical protein RL134_393 [Actinomycetota bacterium]|jgi:hypothetical protein